MVILTDLGYPIIQKKVILDFEKGAMNAIADVHAGNVEIHGCFFHLAQSFLRKINSIGLKVKYSVDQEFMKLIKMFMALSFLPSDDIPKAFDELKVMATNEISDFVNYVEEYYVHGKNSNPPMFPPDFWSTYDATGEGTNRTQNFLESFHSKFNKIVGASHVGIFRLISELQNEAEEQIIEITKLKKRAWKKRY